MGIVTTQLSLFRKGSFLIFSDRRQLGFFAASFLGANLGYAYCLLKGRKTCDYQMNTAMNRDSVRVKDSEMLKIT